MAIFCTFIPVCGGVDDVAVSHVHGEVAYAAEEHQVTWLESGGGDVRQGGPLRVSGRR
jgi:hypothetical protein